MTVAHRPLAAQSTPDDYHHISRTWEDWEENLE